MKNYLTTSFKESPKGILLLVFALICSMGMAQTGTVTVISPAMDTSVCVELTDEVCLDIEVQDENGTVVSPLSLQSISWSGPNGFTSDVASPCVDVDDMDVDGIYTVIVTFNNGSTAEGTREISVTNVFDLECPEDDFIFPDLDNNCALSYTCLLYTSPSPRDGLLSRMPSSA